MIARKLPLSLVLVILLCPFPVHAQMAVHDPINYVNAVLRYRQLVQEYQMMYWEFRGLLNLGQFRSPRTVLRLIQAANTSVDAKDFEHVLRSDRTPGEVDAAFNKMMTRLRDIRGVIQTAKYDPVQATKDMIEILDESSKSSAGTIGQIRDAEHNYQLALKNLEASSAVTGGVQSNEKSNLQRINAATLMAVKEQHKTNELLLHLLEQQTLMNQRNREALVAGINDEVNRLEVSDKTISALTARPFEVIRYR